MKSGEIKNSGSHDEGKFNQIIVFPQYTNLTMLASLYFLNLKKKLDTAIKHFNFNLIHYNKSKFALTLIQLFAITNLFQLEVVQY